jgi:hypothetical protein
MAEDWGAAVAGFDQLAARIRMQIDTAISQLDKMRALPGADERAVALAEEALEDAISSIDDARESLVEGGNAELDRREAAMEAGEDDDELGGEG